MKIWSITATIILDDSGTFDPFFHRPQYLYNANGLRSYQERSLVDGLTSAKYYQPMLLMTLAITIIMDGGGRHVEAACNCMHVQSGLADTIHILLPTLICTLLPPAPTSRLNSKLGAAIEC